MKYFHSERDKKHTYAIFSFLAGFGMALLVVEESMKLKDYIPSLATLFAAFLGAYLAFKLSSDKEERKERLNNREAINFALFTLVRQKNAISLSKKTISGYEPEFALAFNMPAMKNAEYRDLVINFDDLSFILNTDEPSVLMELTIEQERFEQAMDAIKIRNEFYVNEFQPVLSDLGLNDRKVEVDEFHRELGDRIFYGCINGAKSMKEHILQCDESIPIMHKILFDLARKLFPGEKFVKWEEKA